MHRSFALFAALLLAAAGLATPAQNVAANGSGGTVTDIHFFGDSISAGATLGKDGVADVSKAWTTRSAASVGATPHVFAISYDQACDVFRDQIYPSYAGNLELWGAASAPLFSIAIGTNDTDHYGAGAGELTFSLCHNALITWLGVPRENKIVAGDAALSATGACGTAAVSSVYGGAQCTGAGTLTASGLVSYGNPIYIWYTLDDNAAASSSFSVSIDGVSQAGTFLIRPPSAMATYNGGTSSVALARFPGNSGTHSITVTTSTGGIAINGFGTPPAQVAGTTHPTILVTDVPNQLEGEMLAPVPTQLQYTANISADVAQAVADGIDARVSPTRQYMLGTAAEMNNQVHPNAGLGTEHMMQSFLNTRGSMPTTVSGVSGPTCSGADSFSGNGPLSACWLQTTVGGNSALVQSSGRVAPPAGAAGAAVYNSGSNGAPSQALITYYGGNYTAIGVDMDPATLHGMYFFPATNNLAAVGGSFSVPCPSHGSGITYRLSRSGTTYTVTDVSNGTPVCSGNYAGLAPGLAGIYVDRRNGNTDSVSVFQQH